MSNRANTIGVVAFVAALVMMDAVVLTLPKYQRRHREQIARSKRSNLFRGVEGNYQEMLSSSSRDQQQEFNQALGTALSTLITMRDLTTGANDYKGRGGQLLHLTSVCLNRASRFNRELHDRHRTNPTLPLPEPTPPNLQNCLSNEQTASLL